MTNNNDENINNNKKQSSKYVLSHIVVVSLPLPTDLFYIIP